MHSKQLLPTLFGAAGLISSCLAHPHIPGMPKLMGRNGAIDIRDLPDLSALRKRVVTPDETCGGVNGYTCRTDSHKCCSQHGWCGDTDDHCSPSKGCQSAFGICLNQPTPTNTANPTASPTSTNGRCGPNNGNQVCGNNQCCSAAGFCGTSKDHCASPDCLVGFGKCDADALPTGASTANVPRTKWGSVPFNDIYDCATVGEVAITYDDGPDIYTDAMLDTLAKHNAKATFFITGNNNGKGQIDDPSKPWPAVIRRMKEEGHQLASHTWSHADLSTLTEQARRDEMVKNEMALRNIVGFFPTYMRPPYSSCNAACVKTMQDLGYHISYFDLDTDDYNNVTPDKIQNAKNNFKKSLDSGTPQANSWLAIAHDIHQQTALNLTAFMLEYLEQKGYKAVTMGKCLNDPQENWYRNMDGQGGLPPDPNQPTPTATPTQTPNPNCTVFGVGSWCATPLPKHSTIPQCWAAVDSCYTQGEACWNTVPWPTSEPCGDYQQVCAAHEACCQACADSSNDQNGPCAQCPVVYPTKTA